MHKKSDFPKTSLNNKKNGLDAARGIMLGMLLGAISWIILAVFIIYFFD
jgi:hypothetical protein